MKIIKYIKQKYSDAKDVVLLFYIKIKLKSIKKKEVEMIDKVLKIWK